MNVERGRGWGARNTVIAIGVVAALAFVLIALVGSDTDSEAARTLGTAFGVVLFTALGSVGVALIHWQPRFALFGAVTVTLSLLACGATIVSVWGDTVSAYGFFGYGGTSGTVGAITDLLALAASATCVLLGLVRPEDDRRAKLVQVAAVGALALLIVLAIVTLVVTSIDLGPRVYAILATVYVVATAVLLVLRLLPAEADPPTVS
jgi:hypothetical protein